MTKVVLYDTTLRDGTQREGLSLSCDDKLRIARKLDELGVAFIEGGWPGSNPKDAEFFARARAEDWRADIVAFGATRRAGLRPEDDPGLRALLDAGTRVVTVFGKSSIFHVTDVLRVSPAENLAMIAETIAFLRAHGRRVIYDAEHFFDGFALDPGYAVETLRAAAGAEALVLCDTNGGMLPWRIGETVARVRADVGGDLGIHAHDDAGCAVANSIAAVRAGARHVQGTINGYGERCGNANLCIVAPDLELKEGMRCLPDLARIAEAARFVAEVANLAMDEHMPYVGRSAFAHKGGVHVAAMRRHAASYQHVDPGRVGNASRVVVSELSGRGNVLSKAEEYGIPVDAPEAALAEIKAAEARGASFEAAEASAALLLARGVPGYRAPFELVEYRVFSGSGRPAEATLKLAVGGEVLHTAAEGNGPVSALDAALRKALVPVYPALAGVTLVDYKVRILDGARGTAATVRVLIDSTDGRRRFSAVGAGTDILAASWAALADSMEFALFRPEVLDESEDRPSAW